MSIFFLLIANKYIFTHFDIIYCSENLKNIQIGQKIMFLLADDFGKMLNNGAHLSSLRRTKIGDFSVDNAFGVLAFEEDFKAI